MRAIILILISIILASCGEKKRNEAKQLETRYNLLSPDSLLIKEFEINDIVFLGESHRLKQQTEFVNEIIPILYKNGVRIVFSEFANYSDTQLADSIITAKEFNENAALRLIHNSGWEWAYQEYVDLYRAAWNINKQILPNQKPIRIIGLQPDINYSAIQTPQDWDLPEKIMKFWNETDSTSWLAIIENEAISKKEKALVYCGRHHAFSKFHQPIMNNEEFLVFEKNREGTRLLRKYPNRVSTILLHSYWTGKKSYFSNPIFPFNGILDSIYQLRPIDNHPYGFQTNNSKLGDLIDSLSTYSNGRDTVMLKDICDGYIVLKPICKLSLVSLISDFIDESNFENSKVQDYPYNFYTNWTIQSMNDTLKKWHKDEETYLENVKKNCN
jgi:hypothetical protein